ncbi:PREDICTED: polygalacturonase inhibitor-like [Ipomoea nil]|uniref:polygalacturonase inhibitor-like n=1 Tax=Ipomoea nil TaxID=35883 RepID=UPI0009018B79|nr:PREDICTED: polygalacturonase inhibitor-like [Ipomoea nil]XP_019187481.1 PREDICTED: polygalacturonase inhibitor-like [Ipomoea nil]
MNIISSRLPFLPLSLILFLSLLSPSPVAGGERCHPYDKKVLLKIKEDLGNPYHFASWDPKTDCCDWYVAKCDETTNRITTLNVITADFAGQIPASVGDLTYLKTLIFHKVAKLTGNIPSSVTKLTHLTFLEVSWTNVSGAVPAFLSQLKNLTYLDLSFNNFSGSIPESLGELKNLEALHLDRNKLTGTIPESFGKFPKAPALYLSHNQLTGTLPESFAKLDFETIDLSRNKLEGDASFLFGKNKTVQVIDLSRNAFQFDFSKVKGFSDSLTLLDLNHNKIAGALPAALTKIENLQLFNVSYNRLCGEIPQGGELQRFNKYAYLHNKCLCGPPLPAC